jgi:hypothetical protein
LSRRNADTKPDIDTVCFTHDSTFDTYSYTYSQRHGIAVR